MPEPGGTAMERTMQSQPEALRRILDDQDRAHRVADRLHGRRVFVVGTGTSWHAASVGAFWLRLGGVDALAVHSSDALLYGPRPSPHDALILVSHAGSRIYTMRVLEDARRAGVPSVLVSRLGMEGADLETVAEEESSAHTSSYLGSLLRLAQVAQALGAQLGRLEAVPDAVAQRLAAGDPGVEPPARLLEFAGAGPNQWTAMEGALKTRETSYVATEGLNFEQCLHGPAVALTERDALVLLEGGGDATPRLAELAEAATVNGTRVYRFGETELGEPLSVFPLTVVVQLIALGCAKRLGTNPDSFGRDLPGRAETWTRIEL